MSVRTTADEHLDKAKENIDEAIKNLHCIVVENVFGSDEYYQSEDKFYQAYISLLEIKRSMR